MTYVTGYTSNDYLTQKELSRHSSFEEAVKALSDDFGVDVPTEAWKEHNSHGQFWDTIFRGCKWYIDVI